jgi:thiol-disulfide isomerase/thioredoxin
MDLCRSNLASPRGSFYYSARGLGGRIVNIRSLFAALILALSIPPLQGNAQSPTPASPSADQKKAQPPLGPARHGIAPNFALESLTGETVHLSDFRGKVVLLEFWATWCGPCKIITPWLIDLQNQYGPQGLAIVGIALDEDATKVEIAEFADNMRVNYITLIGNEKVAQSYGGIPAMPVRFFIGRDGKVVNRMIGLSSKAEIEESIKKALESEKEMPGAAVSDNTPAQSHK